jgi:3-deoxy-D-manno-octulosonic-acid transferase
VLCQTKADAERFKRLGVLHDKLAVTGSIKFDIQISKEVKEKGKALRGQLGSDRPIWIAASTHKGEDEQILEAHKQVLKLHSNALLILVPRHPERFDDVFELSQTLGFETERRTDYVNNHLSIADHTQVYLGDTMGEMLVLMGAADICFMGGSLIGDKVGGHNVLEPAALGLPVITGPSYFNFSEVVNQLISNNGIVISNKKNLNCTLDFYFSNIQERKALAENALKVVRVNIGSIKNTIKQIHSI